MVVLFDVRDRLAIVSIAQATERVGIDAGADGSDASVCQSEMAKPSVPTAPTDQIIARGAWISSDRDCRSADTGEVVEVVAVEDKGVFWGLLEFAHRDVHFADEERIAHSVVDILRRDAIFPADRFVVRAFRTA